MLCAGGVLTAGVVDVGIAGEQYLGDRHDRVPLREQVFDDGGQRLGRVQSRVVKQHDAPRLQVLRHPLENRLGVVVLPVQTCPAGNRLKPAARKGIFPIPPAYHAMR